MKPFYLLACLLCLSISSIAAPTKKIIDEGGSGQFKAEAISQ